jgi:TolA-binding protein
MNGNPLTSMRTGLCVVSFLLAVGCSGDKAKELLETAEFEERQMNLPHAKQLYDEIIHTYPGTKEAATARARLSQLDAKP